MGKLAGEEAPADDDDACCCSDGGTAEDDWLGISLLLLLFLRLLLTFAELTPVGPPTATLVLRNPTLSLDVDAAVQFDDVVLVAGKAKRINEIKARVPADNYWKNLLTKYLLEFNASIILGWPLAKWGKNKRRLKEWFSKMGTGTYFEYLRKGFRCDLVLNQYPCLPTGPHLGHLWKWTCPDIWDKCRVTLATVRYMTRGKCAVKVRRILY